MSRRRVVVGAAAVVLAALRRPRPAAAQPASAGPAAAPLVEDLVAANRILVDQGVLDGYGHVSARHDRDPGRYLMSRSLAPELVTAVDVMEYDLDSEAVDPRGRASYLERFIHGEIYRARPDVRAIVHSHSPSVIPFGTTGVPLRPLYHMSAFLGEGVPVFEIRQAAGGDTDMLVRTPALGRALAQVLAARPVALMRGHGAVAVGASLPQVVFRSVYTEMNARLQAQAMALGPVTYLSPEEARRAEAVNAGTLGRPWELWEAESEEEPVTALRDLETPAVTVHLDVMEDNIRRVQAHLDRHRIANRPHIKTHKIPDIGKMQMAAGAVGITCQKLGEVEVFADAGVAEDVLLTYNILGAAKTERLMALARRIPRLTVVFDNEVVARELSEAAARHRTELGFLVECDTGFRRTGVQTPDEAFALARAAMARPGLRFAGLMTFPNRDPDTREFFERALTLFKQAGIPVPVVSGGGTPALATVDRFPMLTEHRAGTCVYNDAMVVSSGTATWDQCAMRVRATVVSRPTDDRGVLDAGSKVLTSDLYHMKGYGHLMEYPEAQVAHLSEEHAVVDFSACAERPKVGEVVSVVPNHCCVVTNMVDEIYGVRSGTVEVVWPVAARGRVR